MKLLAMFSKLFFQNKKNPNPWGKNIPIWKTAKKEKEKEENL
jgi:hypothetical protein